MTPLRVAVITPFLDKRHGTERCVAEQIERLARDHGWSVDIYSQRVEDIALDDGRIAWHRVPASPGPYIVNYLWWFGANHLARRREERRGVRYDVVYSPGINCLDADAISVHIVFGEFVSRVGEALSLRRNPVRTWPRLLHRRFYYRLIVALERLVYGRGRAALSAISKKTAAHLDRLHGRGGVPVIYHGIDRGQFNPEVRRRRRRPARAELGLADSDFAVLLVGNDWKQKGLDCMLEAVGLQEDGATTLLVAGRDDPVLFAEQIAALGLRHRVRLLPLRRDVETYYAAADCYAGPSLEDAFALPPLEAMACGLPVIISARAGVSEVVTDGHDGLVQKDPRDAAELARLIRDVREDADLRRRLGERATETACRYTWERNAAETAAFLRHAIRPGNRA
jgi:glycosyltransferase involved in cell wall biosynthesis